MILLLFTASVILSTNPARADQYPDQFYVIENSDSLLYNASEVYGISSTADGSGIELKSDTTSGYIILREQTATSPFNRGLPSWNGTALSDNASFKIYIRFPIGTGWSPWLTVGYWKKNLWPSYGATQYSGGKIDIDYVKLYSYKSKWQYKIAMKRNATSTDSPTLHKISFFASDTGTTSNLDYTSILNDKPDQIFIPTTFLHQYSIDPDIGGRICSPTSVSMILLSYDIEVNPLDFANDTYDSYWGIFGIWPRVVQNASEYNLDGAVTRYRTWSEAYDVLANGGRIAMSVGPPLYSGHLMMLAGFTSNGNPIVHDPARSNGYGYIFDKSDLSHSWFDKGGVGYTFVRKDTVSGVDRKFDDHDQNFTSALNLISNYPNPFNASTRISFTIKTQGKVELKVYDITGRCVKDILNSTLPPQRYEILWDGTDNNNCELGSGIYFCVLSNPGNEIIVTRMLMIK